VHLAYLNTYYKQIVQDIWSLSKQKANKNVNKERLSLGLKVLCISLVSCTINLYILKYYTVLTVSWKSSIVNSGNPSETSSDLLCLAVSINL